MDVFKKSDSTVKNNAALNANLEFVDSAAYIVDTEGKVFNCNSAFLKLVDLQKIAVIGKKIDQLDIYLPKVMHQNNIMLLESEAEQFNIIEFIKHKTASDSALFQSQKKIIRDQNNQKIGLISIAKQHLPNKISDVVSFETKHRLREVLNAFYGYHKTVESLTNTYNSSLSIGLQAIIDKLNTIVEAFKVENTEALFLPKDQSHWCKVLWISDSIASFVFQPGDDGLIVDKIDSQSALEAAQTHKISRNEYQIILIDKSLSKLAPTYFKFSAESALIIQVVQELSSKSIHPEIGYHKLINDHAAQLPQIWQKHISSKTIQKVNKSKQLHVLSIEDDKESQNALKQLLALYDFIDTKTCANAKQAQRMLLEYSFDLIILDFGLPDAPNNSGYDMALLIRNIQKKKGDFFCPIIVNTGHEFDADSELLFRYGINEFYRKPELVRNLDTILSGYIPKKFSAIL